MPRHRWVEVVEEQAICFRVREARVEVRSQVDLRNACFAGDLCECRCVCRRHAVGTKVAIGRALESFACRESVADLHKTRENVSDDEWFPFTVVSDESLNHFKAYRAFDDFEEEALHGTFLIDGEGQVRWQDISFEPFMQPEFLLEETQRLLLF